jgi:hypothetical protein
MMSATVAQRLTSCQPEYLEPTRQAGYLASRAGYPLSTHPKPPLCVYLSDDFVRSSRKRLPSRKSTPTNGLWSTLGSGGPSTAKRAVQPPDGAVRHRQTPNSARRSARSGTPNTQLGTTGGAVRHSERRASTTDGAVGKRVVARRVTSNSRPPARARATTSPSAAPAGAARQVLRARRPAPARRRGKTSRSRRRLRRSGSRP